MSFILEEKHGDILKKYNRTWKRFKDFIIEKVLKAIIHNRFQQTKNEVTQKRVKKIHK